MRRPVAPLRALGVAAALSACLTGCGVHAQRRAAATDVCVAALPVAQALVGPQARLAHLKRLSVRDAAALRSPAAPVVPPAGPAGGPSAPGALCAVAYRGSFDAGRLPARVHASGGTGPVLVLLLTVRHPRVVDALVRQDLPRQLAH